jgi:hypothetical protein
MVALERLESMVADADWGVIEGLAPQVDVLQPLPEGHR